MSQETVQMPANDSNAFDHAVYWKQRAENAEAEAGAARLEAGRLELELHRMTGSRDRFRARYDNAKMADYNSDKCDAQAEELEELRGALELADGRLRQVADALADYRSTDFAELMEPAPAPGILVLLERFRK